MTVEPRNRFGCGLGSSDETVMFEVSQNSNLILIFAKYTVHTDLGVLGQGLRRTLARSVFTPGRGVKEFLDQFERGLLMWGSCADSCDQRSKIKSGGNKRHEGV